MDNINVLTYADQWEIKKSFIEGMSTLVISKDICRDHRNIKIFFKYISKFGDKVKEKGLENMLPSKGT